jgi:hypothetical protein
MGWASSMRGYVFVLSSYSFILFFLVLCFVWFFFLRFFLVILFFFPPLFFLSSFYWLLVPSFILSFFSQTQLTQVLVLFRPGRKLWPRIFEIATPTRKNSQRSTVSAAKRRI